jgi:hypothetical protein
MFCRAMQWLTECRGTELMNGMCRGDLARPDGSNEAYQSSHPCSIVSSETLRTVTPSRPSGTD